MVEPQASILMLILAIVSGYLLGALPVAEQVSRLRGVDIFSAGTGLAGASNVRRCVGRWHALAVLIGDLGKGALAILVGRYLGVQGPWIILPAVAAVSGHWNSAFTRFRGGDGNATLGGIIIALFPGYGIISITAAILVSLGGQRLPYSSLLNIVAGYLTLVALSFTYQGDPALTLGVGGLCAMVLAHAALGHLRRRRAATPTDEWSDMEDAPEQPHLKP